VAQTVYMGKVAITTQALRVKAYEKLHDLLDHLVNLNTDLVSIVVDQSTHVITVTLTNAIPVVQVDHLGLVVP
jgi:hypothetical protein